MYKLFFDVRKVVKGIVHPKIKIYSPSGHKRCRGVCFLIRKDLEKCSDML